jgi:hypothetical protein
MWEIYWISDGCQVNRFDYAEENLPLFDVQTAFSGEVYASLEAKS